MKLSPLAAAVLGLVAGLVCFAFVIVAHLVKLELESAVQLGLIAGGATAMGVGWLGALKTPTTPPAPPGGTP